jgi:uncharacterized lipoprotein YddW (UPF0748 family)
MLMLRRLLFPLLLLISLPLAGSLYAGKAPREARGLWVECEGSQGVLYSRKKIDLMIRRAKKSGFNILFVQVYRHDRAWYNSVIADTAPYRRIITKEKIDPLAYIIKEGHRAGLEVHGWLNMFRIGKDARAVVLRRLGKDAVTRDGKGRSLLYRKSLPDGGYWLDPGDSRVRKYLLNIITEVVRKYPGLDGVHLDFIRYPYFSPTGGSFWAGRHDLGYGEESVRRFRKWTGLNPLKMKITRSNCQAWDDWRRHQLNNFLESVQRQLHALNRRLKLSAAVVAWADRAYLSSFQDWRRWLEEGLVDFVVVMNYSTDARLARYLAQGALASQQKRQVYVGLGAYLLLNQPRVLIRQIEDCRRAGAPGVVLFSYDALCKDPKIFDLLRAGVFSRPAVIPAMPWKKSR